MSQSTVLLNFIKKETLEQVFSCEFCEISKNTVFTEHLWTTASKKSFGLPQARRDLISNIKNNVNELPYHLKVHSF